MGGNTYLLLLARDALVQLLPPLHLVHVPVKVLPEAVQRVEKSVPRVAAVPLPGAAAQPLQQLGLLLLMSQGRLLCRHVLD